MAVKKPSKVQQTPLEQLTEMNERVGSTRKKSARPRDPTKKVERWYRNQLKSLVRAMAKAVEEEVIPVVKAEKADYQVKDAEPVYTRDAWADRIIAALSSVSEQWVRGFGEQYERMARRTVSMAEAESTQAFVKSVNEAVGVDMSAMIEQEGLQDYVEAATRQNAQLIRSVAEEHFTGIENAILGGVRGGESPSRIAQRIREQTGVSRRNAERIARDQTAKLTSEITERRHTQSGIQYYKAVTANDSRVTGKPGGKYPNAKISCWGIANQDIGYGPGIYKWSEGATWNGQKGLHPGRHHVNCRCVAVPKFEHELPKKAK